MAKKRNNRTAGLGYEREIVQKFNRRTLSRPKLTASELRKIDDSTFYVFPKLATTREVERASDAKKKDITVYKTERVNEFPYAIQTKNYSSILKYTALLEEVKTNNPDRIPVVFHKYTEKADIKFVTKGEYAIVYLEDFMDIIYKLAELEFNLKQIEVNEL